MRRATCTQLLMLIILVMLAACSEPVNLKPPPEEQVLEVLEAVLGSGRGEIADLPVAIGIKGEDGLTAYRSANAEEREALFLPDEMAGIAVKQMRSKYYPKWRVLFYEVREKEEVAPYVASVITIEGKLSLVIQWRRALRLPNGELRPDVRPRPGRGDLVTDEKVTMVVFPAWDAWG